jgi:hypothetical protein
LLLADPSELPGLEAGAAAIALRACFGLAYAKHPE